MQGLMELLEKDKAMFQEMSPVELDVEVTVMSQSKAPH